MNFGLLSNICRSPLARLAADVAEHLEKNGRKVASKAVASLEKDGKTAYEMPIRDIYGQGFHENTQALVKNKISWAYATGLIRFQWCRFKAYIHTGKEALKHVFEKAPEPTKASGTAPSATAGLAATA
jgi:hypothetical protein